MLYLTYKFKSNLHVISYKKFRKFTLCISLDAKRLRKIITLCIRYGGGVQSNWVAMTSSSGDGIGPVDYCLPSTAPTKD